MNKINLVLCYSCKKKLFKREHMHLFLHIWSSLDKTYFGRFYLCFIHGFTEGIFADLLGGFKLMLYSRIFLGDYYTYNLFADLLGKVHLCFI